MLKSPEQVIMRQLAVSPATAIELGHRVYPVLAPASASLPFATVTRSGIEREQTLSSPMGVPTLTVSIAVFAATYEQARRVADAVRGVLDGWHGEAYSVSVLQVSLETESDDFVTLEGGDLPPVYQITLTFDILWQEI